MSYLDELLSRAGPPPVEPLVRAADSVTTLLDTSIEVDEPEAPTVESTSAPTPVALPGEPYVTPSVEPQQAVASIPPIAPPPTEQPGPPEAAPPAEPARLVQPVPSTSEPNPSVDLRPIVHAAPEPVVPRPEPAANTEIVPIEPIEPEFLVPAPVPVAPRPAEPSLVDVVPTTSSPPIEPVVVASPATTDDARRQADRDLAQHAESAPTISVRIGRIVVQPPAAPPARPARAGHRPTHQSLDDYLRRRNS